MNDPYRRIAAALAANGTTRLLVAGDLPTSVRAALPPGVDVLEAQASLSDDSGSSSSAGSGTQCPVALMILRDPAGEARFDKRLGTACRRFPGRLLVWSRTHDDAQALPATRFFAHGFRRVLDVLGESGRETLYEYRLADYKQAPDWLNARFWANPERFAASDP